MTNHKKIYILASEIGKVDVSSLDVFEVIGILIKELKLSYPDITRLNKEYPEYFKKLKKKKSQYAEIFGNYEPIMPTRGFYRATTTDIEEL